MTEPRPDFPPSLVRMLPAARWEDITSGYSGASVWRSRRHVVKVQPKQLVPVSTLQQERERLRWLGARLPCPQVVAYEDTGTHEFLAMTRLPGIDLSHEDARLHPERVVGLLARALRQLHALPIADCPFNMTLNTTLALARERVQADVVDSSDFDAARTGRTPTSVFNELVRKRPEREDLVVTHGDACLPNFIVNGELLEGLIDVGRLGIADRHADLALTYRSTRRNLNSDYAEQFLDLYGREQIEESKLEYFMLQDELF